MRHFAVAVLASLALVAVAQAAPTPSPTPAPLPVPTLRPIESPPPPKTLEQRVAALEAENAQLRRFIAVNGESLTISVPQSLLLRAGTSATVESSAAIALKGATVKINGGAKPVARAGDSVGGSSSPAHILQGSPTVFVD